MSDRTGIEWTDSTWNPVRGCSLVSEGCKNCYAMHVAARFSGPGQPYEGLARRRSNGEPQWTGEARVIEKQLLDPLRWKKPRRVFVNSMSDLFHESLADDQIDRIFAVMALADRHTFQVLTKRPARMSRYLSWVGLRKRIANRANAIMRASRSTGGFDRALSHRFLWSDMEHAQPGEWCNRLSGIADDQWPLPNVWVGTSVENQAAADERVPALISTPAAVRFLSCEPLLGPLDLSPYMGVAPNITGDGIMRFSDLDWIIVGGESGPKARPCRVEWIEDIVLRCRNSGVPVFVKQLGAAPYVANDHDSESWPGASLPLAESYEPQYQGELAPLELCDKKGGDPAEWPEHLRVRQWPAGDRNGDTDG